MAQLLVVKRLRFISGGAVARITAALLVILLMVVFSVQPGLVVGDTSQYGGSTTIVPTRNALLFGSSGNVKIDIPVSGIAVRIEVPREFLQGVVSGENDTHWITSNIRNDYFYYNVVDESRHWTYDWHDNASDGPCFKPNFSYYDPNAPYCVEIWNYLNSPLLKPQQYNVTLGAGQTFDYTDLVGIDYCRTPNVGKFVFGCFTAPKFVMFHNLASPALAGLYNFTVSVANRTNILGYPDFVHAWNTTLFVPVSMAYNAGFISGYICDGGSPSCNPIRGKGIVYAENEATGAIVARAYVDQSLCLGLSECGLFNLTGLAPNQNYLVEGSAGVDNGYAYSLTAYPSTISFLPNQWVSNIKLPLLRAPLLCGFIKYENNTATGAGVSSLTGQINLLNAGYRANPAYDLNITVEAADPSGHVYRFFGISSDSSSGDSFSIVTGVGVKYVGTDPYGTEFAGLPAYNELPGYPQGYQLTTRVYVSGYNQVTFPTVAVSSATDSGTPSCSTPGSTPGVSGSGQTVDMLQSGVISGTLYFCPQPAAISNSTCGSPHTDGEEALPNLPVGNVNIDALFGGNVVVEAYEPSTGSVGGVTVINGTLPNGKTGYESCDFKDTCSYMPFYITGFSEYYDHTLSGVWEAKDSGLPNVQYTLQISLRGYELTPGSLSPNPIGPISSSPYVATVAAYMTPIEPIEVTITSYDTRANPTPPSSSSSPSPPPSSTNGIYFPQAQIPWMFLGSSIPFTFAVCFAAFCVEGLMELGVNQVGVISCTTYSCKVVSVGQNPSLRYIWFYDLLPTTLEIGMTYTVTAYTLGYVPQFPSGVTAGPIGPLSLAGSLQVLLTLFIGNEVDITIPIYHDLSTLEFGGTPEYDHAIGQVLSGTTLMGAETANLTAGVPTLLFNIFGFGGMELSNTTLCNTNVPLVGRLNICGQGHFYYVPPDGNCIEAAAQPGGTGGCIFDYGLGAGTYTAALPEFGFTVHFMQVLALPVVQFNDLFLQQGVFLEAVQMALIMQGATSVVTGYCNSPPAAGFCLGTQPHTNFAPLSWAEVQVSNSTYSRGAPTFDGLYDGVGGLFVPGGTYNVTFSDIQYQSQTVTYQVGWGGSYSLTQPTPLCPIGTTC